MFNIMPSPNEIESNLLFYFMYVYLLRFVVGQDYGEDSTSSDTPDVQEEFFDNYSVQKQVHQNQRQIMEASL